MSVRFKTTIGDIVTGTLAYLFGTPGGLLLALVFVLLTLPPTVSVTPAAFGWVVRVIVVVLLELVLLAAVFVLTVLGAVVGALSNRAGVLTEHAITIDSEGLTEETSLNRTTHLWPGVRRVTCTRSMLLVVVGPGLVHVIPRRAVGSSEEWDRLCAETTSAYRAARA
jgi:hypothetical protein